MPTSATKPQAGEYAAPAPLAASDTSRDHLPAPTGSPHSAPWRDVTLLVLLFVLANGLALFDPVVRWDGLVLEHHLRLGEWDLLRQWFSEAGAPFFYYLHRAASAVLSPVAGYRALAFASLLFAGLGTWVLLGDFAAFGRSGRFALAAGSMLAPVYVAWSEVVLMPYAVVYAAFVAAMLCFRAMLTADGARRGALRVAALALFYAAFMMQSLLVFYAVAMTYAWARTRRADQPFWRSVTGFARRYPDFIVLPFVFFAVATIWYRPYGTYASYNGFAIYPPFLIRSALRALYGTLVEPFVYGATYAVRHWPVFAVAAALLLSRRGVAAEGRRPHDVYLLAFGVLTLGAGIFAYVVVAKPPSLGDWSSRYGMLAPLGITFIVYYGLRVALAAVGRNPALAYYPTAVWLATGVATLYGTQVDLGVDSLKQRALVSELRASPEVAAGSLIVVHDDAKELNAFGRRYRFYDYAALLGQAFGEQRRYGVVAEDFAGKEFATLHAMTGPRRLLRDYTPGGAPVHVRVTRGAFDRAQLEGLYWRDLRGRLAGGPAVRAATLDSVLTLEAIPAR
jgi:hypothetical protein